MKERRRVVTDPDPEYDGSHAAAVHEECCQTVCLLECTVAWRRRRHLLLACAVGAQWKGRPM